MHSEARRSRPAAGRAPLGAHGPRIRIEITYNRRVEPAARVDISGRVIGTPHRVVRVTSDDDIRGALASARESGRAVVPVGLRTSYWGNLEIEGVVLLDMTGYARELAFDEENGVASFESGIDLRTLDRTLRARGYQLASHPDAYGDTPLGASLANGTSAGIGMLHRDFADQVVGFEVMLASGERIQVGASRILGATTGAIGVGVPDLRSLFVGAEGALGVITRVDLRLVPATWEARLTVRTDEDRFDDALALARWWRVREGPHTIRWTFGIGTEGELHVRVASASDPGDLEHRLTRVLATLKGWPEATIERSDDDERRGVSPGYDRRWPGPPGSTWARAAAHPFAGIDGVVPYGEATRAWSWAGGLALDVPHARRRAAYFGRDGVNLGVHCVFGSPKERDAGRATLEGALAEYAAFGAVPYRLGRVWIEHVRSRLDGPTVDLLQRVAAVIDPGGTVSPRVGVFGPGKGERA